MIINRNVQNEQQIWLYDQKGSKHLLDAAPWFDFDFGKAAFSMDESYIAYISSGNYDKTVLPQALHIAATATGAELFSFENETPLGWLGWVP
jgi:hypothetical protein